MQKPDAHMTLCEEKLKRFQTEYREFINVLSHDLAGPFRHVTGFAEMIMSANRDAFDEKTLEHFNYIITAGNNGRTMLENLTSYARLTDNAASVSPIDTCQVIDSILEELNTLILQNNTNINIGTLPEISASKELLRISLFHIIRNAIMYSDTAPRPNVEITGVSTSTHAVYDIIDNGFGMTEYQTDNVQLVLKRAVRPTDYPGHGMGLAIAKKAVEYHNGSLTIESNTETGTKVSISFPFVST